MLLDRRNTDTKNVRRLLSARCARPSGSRSAKQRDEVAPFQWIEFHLLSQPEDSVASYRIGEDQVRCLRQCGIRVWRMTAWGLGRVKTPLEERVMGRDFGWVAAFCQFAEFGEFSIGGGFVASLARPGGNVTGSTLVESSIAGKWLEVLKEIAPRVNRVAFLFNPAAAPYAEYYLVVFKAAAPSLGMEAIAAPINKTSEIEPVIADILMPDTFLLAHRAEVTWLAGRYALPAVYPYEPGHKRCSSRVVLSTFKPLSRSAQVWYASGPMA
jgi:ABC transporter substrate binding protein